MAIKSAKIEIMNKKENIQKEYKLHMDVSQLKSEKLRMKQEIHALERELGDNG